MVLSRRRQRFWNLVDIRDSSLSGEAIVDGSSKSIPKPRLVAGYVNADRSTDAPLSSESVLVYWGISYNEIKQSRKENRE